MPSPTNFNSMVFEMSTVVVLSAEMTPFTPDRRPSSPSIKALVWFLGEVFVLPVIEDIISRLFLNSGSS